jgi:hypothetical protein
MAGELLSDGIQHVIIDKIVPEGMGGTANIAVWLAANPISDTNLPSASDLDETIPEWTDPTTQTPPVVNVPVGMEGVTKDGAGYSTYGQPEADTTSHKPGQSPTPAVKGSESGPPGGMEAMTSEGFGYSTYGTPGEETPDQPKSDGPTPSSNPDPGPGDDKQDSGDGRIGRKPPP